MRRSVRGLSARSRVYSKLLDGRVPYTVTCMIYVGVLMQQHSPSRRCSLEATQSQSAVRPRHRRRPPEFGSTVPTITKRGISTSKLHIVDNRDRDDCPMCKKFSRGPCGSHFTEWLDCTDANPGRDDRGEPLHLNKCSDLAEKLAACLDINVAFYSKNADSDDDVDEDDYSAASSGDALKNAWKEFINEIEDGIKSGKHTLLPFPRNIKPKMELRLSTLTGAAFFVPENDGRPILAAYILDDSSNIIAAASREDLYMNDQLGCVIQFKVVEGMKSLTCRAIYDTSHENDIVIYTRTMLVPPGASTV